MRRDGCLPTRPLPFSCLLLIRTAPGSGDMLADVPARIWEVAAFVRCVGHPYRNVLQPLGWVGVGTAVS
jgi:hypothetical protein